MNGLFVFFHNSTYVRVIHFLLVGSSCVLHNEVHVME